MSGGTIYQMSEAGIDKATMRYEEGGKFEVWTWGKAIVRVPAATPNDEVKRLLTEKAKA